jgi:hypothetical protein
MEFSALAAWFHKFLLIMGGCLVLSLLLLFISNKYTKRKFNQMEQDDKNDN